MFLGNKNWEKHFSRAKQVLQGDGSTTTPLPKLLPSFSSSPKPPFPLVFFSTPNSIFLPIPQISQKAHFSSHFQLCSPSR